MQERARYCDDGPEHPLFMNRAPTVRCGGVLVPRCASFLHHALHRTCPNLAQSAEMAANPHLAALANMAYEGDDTPEALALEAKEKVTSTPPWSRGVQPRSRHAHPLPPIAG